MGVASHLKGALDTLGWGCGMWKHQARAAAGGPSVATQEHLCHLSALGSSGRLHMTQQHNGGTQQGDTLLKSSLWISFHAISLPPQIPENLASGHLSGPQRFNLKPQGFKCILFHQLVIALTVPCHMRAASQSVQCPLWGVCTSRALCWSFSVIWKLHNKSRNFFFVWFLSENRSEKGRMIQHLQALAKEDTGYICLYRWRRGVNTWWWGGGQGGEELLGSRSHFWDSLGGRGECSRSLTAEEWGEAVGTCEAGPGSQGIWAMTFMRSEILEERWSNNSSVQERQPGGKT